jgi:hypothetical protein
MVGSPDRTALVAASSPVGHQDVAGDGENDEGDDDGGLWATPSPTDPSSSAAVPSPAAAPAAAAPANGAGAGTGVRPSGGLSSGRVLVLQVFLVLDCLVVSVAAFTYGRRVVGTVRGRR